MSTNILTYTISDEKSSDPWDILWDELHAVELEAEDSDSSDEPKIEF